MLLRALLGLWEETMLLLLLLRSEVGVHLLGPSRSPRSPWLHVEGAEAGRPSLRKTLWAAMGVT